MIVMFIFLLPVLRDETVVQEQIVQRLRDINISLINIYTGDAASLFAPDKYISQ